MEQFKFKDKTSFSLVESGEGIYKIVLFLNQYEAGFVRNLTEDEYFCRVM